MLKGFGGLKLGEGDGGELVTSNLNGFKGPIIATSPEPQEHSMDNIKALSNSV